MVHEIARLGFGREAEAYERSRPTYPPAAVAWLVDHLRIGPGATVADLAAGTGKLTRLLLPTGASVVAVEPLEGMRRVLQQVVPGVGVTAGVAEALPLRSSSLDAVCVAQAFHWFDADAAFAELARVLRPGGRLGAVWNARDRAVDWVDRTWAIMDEVEKKAPWRDHETWRQSAFGARRGFGPVQRAAFRHEQAMTHDGVVDRIRGVSHVAALDDRARDEVLGELRRLLATHPQTRDRPVLSLPYVTDCLWMERR